LQSHRRLIPVLFLFYSCSIPVPFLFYSCFIPVPFLFHSCSIPVLSRLGFRHALQLGAAERMSDSATATAIARGRSLRGKNEHLVSSHVTIAEAKKAAMMMAAACDLLASAAWPSNVQSKAPGVKLSASMIPATSPAAAAAAAAASADDDDDDGADRE
jgi:hypothetical protein